MKSKLLLVGLIVSAIMLINIVSAESQYGKIDSYYNGEYLPGTEVAKPTLKIGEPFTLRVDVTMYQECKMDIELSLLDKTHFDFIDGIADFNQAASYIFKANETHTFEWTLKPTDNWAGGTVPLNIHYAILLPGVTGSVTDSSFTIAYPYITTEHYKGDTTPTTTTYPESPTSTDDPTTPSTPAFTLLAAALTLTIAAARRS